MQRDHLRKISLSVLLLGFAVFGADWPQFRFDSSRSAASPEALRPPLHLAWKLNLPRPRSWTYDPRLAFDASYQPVCQSDILVLTSMVTDSVEAYDVHSGRLLWRFFTGGPVRCAACLWRGRVYAASDDGSLYCLDLKTGALLWKRNDLPPGSRYRLVLGNGRYIALRPARGGPVIHNGVLYYAKGVWPFEQVSVFALDPLSGDLLWANHDAGLIRRGLLDHSTRRDTGISPQGYLAVLGNRLIVPSGRALPARFDLRKGTMDPYDSRWGGREGLAKGCWFIGGKGRYFAIGGDLYETAKWRRIDVDPANQKELGTFRDFVFDGRAAYFSLPLNVPRGYRPVGSGYKEIVALDLSGEPQVKRVKHKTGRILPKASFPELFRAPADNVKILIKAGEFLCGGKEGLVRIYRIKKNPQSLQKSWEGRVQGVPTSMIAASNRLFVVTDTGSLFCFAPENTPPLKAEETTVQIAPPEDLLKRAKELASLLPVERGQAVVAGKQADLWAVALSRASKLHVTILESDRSRAKELRNRIFSAGLYGSRISVLEGSLQSLPLPRYTAELVVLDSAHAFGGTLRPVDFLLVYRLLRPYGGLACFPVESASELKRCAAELSDTEVSRGCGFAILKRRGALPGSADWTCERADPGGTSVSSDNLVRAPFEILWFGGSIDTIWPDWDLTHSLPPSPVVVKGRMFLVVAPFLHAVDIYTGELLWTYRIPGLENRSRRPQLAAWDQTVYVALGNQCLILSAARGELLRRLSPPQPTSPISHLRVCKNALVLAAGKTLSVYNLSGEKKRWSFVASGHLSDVAVGNDKIFLWAARLPDRRGKIQSYHVRLVALDKETGRPVWEEPWERPPKPTRTFRLAYSARAGVLLAVWGKVRAYEARTGKLLWERADLQGCEEPLLHPSYLITQFGEMYDIRTGKRLPGHLWFGKPNTNWDLGGARGCNRAVAGLHLAFVRDAHASYFDLTTRRHVYLRGVRSGCTNSLIAAGGILNAPNFAYGCSCNYPVFCSYALVPVGGKETVDELRKVKAK